MQNERIQALTDIVVQKDAIITELQDLRSHLEEKVKDYVSFAHLTIFTPKQPIPNPMLVMHSLL